MYEIKALKLRHCCCCTLAANIRNQQREFLQRTVPNEEPFISYVRRWIFNFIFTMAVNMKGADHNNGPRMNNSNFTK